MLVGVAGWRQPRRRTIGWSLFLSLVVFLGAFSTADRALAYRQPGSTVCTPWSAVRWKFGTTTNATPTDLASVKAVLSGSWPALKDFNGSSFMSTTEVTSNHNVVINWDSNVVVASIDCSSSTTVRTITLDPDPSDQEIRYAAIHEVGHAHGIRHSGNVDNLTPESGSTFPLMGCAPRTQTPVEIRADDAAQAFNRFGIRATPNWGFEQGLKYFDAVNAASVTVPYDGSLSALVGNGGTIYTRVRIAESGNYDLVARYRSIAAGASGSVVFRAWRGTVDYTTFPPGSDGCPALNSFSEQTGSQVTTPVNQTRTPTTTWTSFSAQLGAITPGPEGVRIKIEIVNNSGVAIYVDNFALVER